MSILESQATSGADLSPRVRIVASAWTWLWCTGRRERPIEDVAEKLQRSMRVTAKCRYNAAIRLLNQSRFAFFTTTVLSLGLIFIPLIQTAGIKLAFSPSVLNMIQIFLAVSVLIYSVVFATGRYDVRAEKLTQCGDGLKELIRAIERDRSAYDVLPGNRLASYESRYSDIVRDCENHVRSDYSLATLEMRGDYFLTGVPRLLLWSFARLSRATPYTVPVFMLAVEMIFIADMIGITSLFTRFFSGTP